MLLAAKIALGLGATVAAAGAYTFHEGLLRVDVDESRHNGQHIHVWVPAAIVPMAMHFLPRHQMERAGYQAGRFMPLFHAVAKELQKYPEADLVEVRDGNQFVHIRTHNGSLLIDAEEPGQTVHVACPLATIDDVSREIAEFAPAS
ncbi:MAG TPA: hypothetical protein VKH15_12285 [Candidatus Acidoferrum sp.]|jgi:hypothetical protein|nr:hypothetical protein [Candidatus Acidoferrum sp.]